MACLRLAFEKAEGLDDSIGQRPAEIDDLLASPSNELDPAHLRASTVELSAQLVKRHGLVVLGQLAPLFDCGDRVGVGEDLGGLLQGLVFVYRDKHGRRTAPPGDDHMLSEVGNLIDDLAQLTTKLTDWNGLADLASVPYRVHKCGHSAS